MLNSELENFFHTLGFSVVSIALFKIISGRQVFKRRAGYEQRSTESWFGKIYLYIIVFAISLTAGVLSEITQIFFARDASFLDLLRDAVGSLAGLIVVASWDKEMLNGKRNKLVLKIIAICLISLSATPLLRTVLAFQLRNQSLPVLFTFDRWWESHFIQMNGAELEVVIPPSTRVNQKPDNSARITFLSGIYPGVSFNEIYPDWRQFDKLRFSVYSESADTILLCLRIHDYHHNNEFYDRFNTRFTVAPGESIISVSISEVMESPRNRRMDMSQISGLILFVVEPNEPLILYMDDFILCH